MSLRKVSSINSASPLNKGIGGGMDRRSYGLENGDDADDDDDYDKTAKKIPPPSSGNILSVLVPPLISITPNDSFDQSASPQSRPPPAPSSRTPPPRSSSADSNHGHHQFGYGGNSRQSSSSSSLPPPFVMQVTAIASLGGVLFGYDMGVIAGALPQLKTAFDLSDKQEELVVSILYVGGGLGAAFGGSLCDFLGRKPAILWTDVTFMIGASILFTAPHVASVLVGRVVVGFAVAVSGIADVSYLHEIAPTQWRGAIVSVNEACISLGFLFAFIVGTVLTPEELNVDDNTHHPPRGWRYMFGLGGVLALIQFVGMWSMPESPIWLRDQGRHEESRAALRRINGGDPVPTMEDCEGTAADHVEEFDDENVEEGGDVALESNASYESLPGTSLDHNNNMGVAQKFRVLLLKCRRAWRHLKSILTKYRRQVWIALFLSVTQQFCGQTSVLNYAPTILRAVVQQDNADGSGDDELSGWATLSIGLVKFIATVLVIWRIEFMGRRKLLLLGMGTIAFGLLLVAVAFSASSPYLRERHADNNGAMVQSGSGFYFALPGVLLVVSGYSMSFGPLTWLLTSELFPTDIRGRALGTSTIVTYLCAAVVTYSFLTAQSLLGTSTVFLMYMLITVVGMVFACMAIPDTGGKTQEEIDADLSNMPWWRRFSGRSSSTRHEPKRWRRGSSSSSRNGTAADSPLGLLHTPTSNGTVEAELT